MSSGPTENETDPSEVKGQDGSVQDSGESVSSPQVSDTGGSTVIGNEDGRDGCPRCSAEYGSWIEVQYFKKQI